jgi:uncharacterized protein with NRDE domain
MCTLALYLRQFEDFPLVIAANRDEHFSRPSAAPRIISDDPVILAGKDLVAGGTWLGVNAHGLSAGIVNRSAKPGRSIAAPRSRGLLCLDMLKEKNAAQAEELLRRQDPSQYQPFVLLVADAGAAFAGFNSESEVRTVALDAGIHVFGNRSFSGDDRGKLKHAHDLFSTAGEALRAQLQGSMANLDTAVSVLRKALSDHAPANHSHEPKDAICVHGNSDYGTVSSSIIFQSRGGKRFHFYHAAGAPCRAAFEAVEPLQLL